jgi:beta-galactosidase
MFKHDFLWGAALAGFQFEMGDPSGKYVDANTDWFKWVHDAGNIQRKLVSGDFPEDGINYWETYRSDHDLAKSLGMNAYRIGVEWSRVFPKTTASVDVGVETEADGTISRVDMDDSDLLRLKAIADAESLRHYRDVVDDLRSKGFKVIVCLNHFSLPLWVHDPIESRESGLTKGPRGWYDEGSVVEFAKYAALLASELGGGVDMWASFNEPMVVSEMGYLLSDSGFPPGIGKNLAAALRVARNMVNAHARAYDAIKKFDNQRAEKDSPSPAWVGMIHNWIPTEPLDASSSNDVKGAEFWDRFHNQLFIEAASSGWFDRDLTGLKSKDRVTGHLGNRLDWLGVNYYTRNVAGVAPGSSTSRSGQVRLVPELARGYGFSCEPNSRSLANRPTSDCGWEYYPEGMTQALVDASKFGHPMYVTENGIADSTDRSRPKFLVDHIGAVERLLEQKKVDVRGYMHWALTDNYEWARGFGMRFGLIAVDMRDKKRTVLKGAKTFKRIVEQGTTEGVTT